MKFSMKLVLCLTVTIGILFSIGGYWMVNQNYKYNLETTIERNLSQHTLEYNIVESSVVTDLLGGIEVNSMRIREYGGSLSSYLGAESGEIALYNAEKQECYSSLTTALPQQILDLVLNKDKKQYFLKEIEGKQYMLLATHLYMEAHSMYVLSVFDISPVFAERQRQVKSFWMLDSAIMLLSFAVVYGVSALLTRPIKKLGEVSRQIAQGAYSERTGIHTGDEIGELSRNFDRMADAVEDKVEKLHESLEQRDAFISSFSHEIKTPMTAIMGYSDLLRSKQCSTEQQVRAATYIFHESKRLEQLSQKLMNLMSLTERQWAFTAVPIERISAEYKETPPGQLPVEVEVEPALVKGDGDLLASLIKNLIQNARRACSPGDAVRLAGKRRGELYVISVTDTGCGIAPEELEHITEPFYMVDKSRSRATGGAGLGLALGVKIAALHGSKLKFESKPGVGTKVSFGLEVYENET